MGQCEPCAGYECAGCGRECTGEPASIGHYWDTGAAMEYCKPCWAQQRAWEESVGI